MTRYHFLIPFGLFFAICIAGNGKKGTGTFCRERPGGCCAQNVPVPFFPLHVLPGFVIEKIAGEPQTMFPMFAVLDNRGRLFVAESSGLDLYRELQKLTRKCRIRLLEDPDENGRFRKSRIFADKLVFPMGLAWRDGKLYVADPPDLIVLEDTDNDGKADTRKVILTGFGHRDNGSLHGLTFGPDGMLYMTVGRPDGYNLKRADGSVLRGTTGALLRCRPDGSHPEVLCRGFENLVEVIFTRRGEIIGTDNWFQRPHAGVRDALVHLMEGGLYPLHADAGTPQPILGEKLPAVSLYPAVALSGLVRYRGDVFPEKMHGNLFSAQHNSRKIVRHVLVPHGSTFRTEDHDFVWTDDPDFHPSDVLESADGSLIVVDTGSWYTQHCPTGRIRKVRAAGGIYRVRPKQFKPHADPWGMKISWRSLSQSALAKLLGNRRAAVRDRARESLVRQGKSAVGPLRMLMRKSANPAVKQRALWSLARIPDEDAGVPLRRVLADSDSNVAVTAARCLAMRQDRQAAPLLVPLLKARSPQLRLAAAEALAHCGGKESLPAIWRALAARPDRFLEHALLFAAYKLADDSALEKALDHPHPAVQRAALILLDQPTRNRTLLAYQAVERHLSASNAALRKTAMQILQRHPDWAGQAQTLIRAWLGKSVLSKEKQQGLAELLSAFQKQKSIQTLMAAVLVNRENRFAQPQRFVVLRAVGQSSLSPLPKKWVKALSRMLNETDAELRQETVHTLAVLQLPELDDRLLHLAKNPKENAKLRLEALRAVIARRPKLSPELFALVRDQLANRKNPLCRLAAAETLSQARLSDKQLARTMATLRGDVLISPSIILPALKRSVGVKTSPLILAYLQDSLQSGWRPGETELQQFLKVIPPSFQSQAKHVHAQWQKAVGDREGRLRQLEALLTGGDGNRGRLIFFGKKAACATCHAIGNEGGRIAPDLTKIGAVRSGRDLLEAVVYPSSTIAQGYDQYQVITKSGRVAGGMIARQDGNVLILRNASGAEVRLHKKQIAHMNRHTRSLMPDGFDRLLRGNELRDLFAFLKSLR